MADCPVCLIYERCAQAAALLEDLTPQAMEMGRVPDGLGGTIPLARQRLIEADQQLHRLLDSGYDVQHLDACVEQTMAALAGWLTPGQVAVVAAMARECRRQAYRLAWQWFLATGQPAGNGQGGGCSTCGSRPA